MAIISFLNENGGPLNPYERLDPLKTIERYITDKNKAKSGFIGHGALLDDDLVGCMNIASALFGELDGAKVYHMVLSFSPEEVSDPEFAHEIARHICYCIEAAYQVCYAVDENTNNLHIHFVFNSSSYLDGQFYYATEQENKRLSDFIARILNFYGNIKLERG